MEISMKHFLISCFSPWTIGVSASSSPALGFSFSLAPSLISLFPLDFFSLPPTFYVYSFYSPSLRSYSSTIHLLEPFSLTTIKRLYFKGKSRESLALPSEWHRIKLLGALESWMRWIPPRFVLCSLPFVVVSVRAQNTVQLNGRSEAPLVVTMWLLVIGSIFSSSVTP